MWCKICCCANKCLHEVQANINIQSCGSFCSSCPPVPKNIASALSTFWWSVNVDGRPHLSAPTILVRLLFNISVCTYGFHFGKVFCPYLAGCWRWISGRSIPSLSSGHTVALLLFLGANLKWSVEVYSVLTRPEWTAAEPHSQHVTVWPWALIWPNFSSAAKNKTQIFIKFFLLYMYIITYFIVNLFVTLRNGKELVLRDLLSAVAIEHVIIY
jgi:hypothetical protein